MNEPIFAMAMAVLLAPPVSAAPFTLFLAHAVAFLASLMSDFNHGANLRVDGGMNPTVN